MHFYVNSSSRAAENTSGVGALNGVWPVRHALWYKRDRARVDAVSFVRLWVGETFSSEHMPQVPVIVNDGDFSIANFREQGDMYVRRQGGSRAKYRGRGRLANEVDRRGEQSEKSDFRPPSP